MILREPGIPTQIRIYEDQPTNSIWALEYFPEDFTQIALYHYKNNESGLDIRPNIRNVMADHNIKLMGHNPSKYHNNIPPREWAPHENGFHQHFTADNPKDYIKAINDLSDLIAPELLEEFKVWLP